MKTAGDLLWLVLCGLWIALGWLFWHSSSPSPL
jgi:uncharacterized membrane protein YccF (DUF307 family)